MFYSPISHKVFIRIVKPQERNKEMNTLMKFFGGVACFMDAFDDAKIPRLKFSSGDNDLENENNSYGGTYHSTTDRSYSLSSPNAVHTSDDSSNEDADEYDSAFVETAVSAARLGRVLRVVNKANHIAACRR